jgi:hypothetical protein
MNGWDVLTWVMALVLGLGAIIVFGFFLRDAGRIWRQLDHHA